MSADETNKAQGQEQVKPVIVKTLGQRLREATDDRTYQNMIKLSNQDKFEIPAGSKKFFKRKMLKPKELVDLNELQDAMEAGIEKPKDRMINLKKQAQICLEGMTDKEWEETDAVLVEMVVGACYLISKGFCEA
jgi:hypothetical protein